MARILLTGATGFIGGATLARLIRRHPAAPVLALVRARSDDDARARLRNSLLRFEPAATVDAGLAHITPIAADLTDPATLADPRLDAATHVIHAAANTSFRSIRGVRRVNIFGTLALAHRMQRAPNLERFLLVGTAFSCGIGKGSVVREDAYPDPASRHIVEYTASKAEAEMLLSVTAPDLPVVVALPSIVIGHTQLGCAPSGSLMWLYRTMDLLRCLPGPLDMAEDVVPVDYCAHALLHLALKPKLAHTRYHISAGDRAQTWRDLSPAFDRHHGARPNQPWRNVPAREIANEKPRLKSLLGPGDEDRLLMALELYYSFADMGVDRFDNSRLLAEGMAPPPRFSEWLDACLTHPPHRSVYDQMHDDD